MEEVAKKPTLLSVLFGNNTDSSNSIDITDPRLIESNNNVNELEKQTTQPIVTEGNKSSKNGRISGLKSKERINNTLDKMRKTLEEQTRQSEINGREDR